MSDAFRLLLKQVGSGAHTSRALSRAEASQAMTLMLKQEATPAQIGAFMIAHRIKRPTPEELAGMLDAYDQLGPRLESITNSQVFVFCHPYDGRSRTLPVAPLVSLILASEGIASVFHGGRRMPTKFGVPLVELWQGLGVNWTGLPLASVRQVLEKAHVGFVYLPTHFPLAEGLTVYREEIGKRPPLASMELAWNPYTGPATLVSGFVHPPTEERLLTTLRIRETQPGETPGETQAVPGEPTGEGTEGAEGTLSGGPSQVQSQLPSVRKVFVKGQEGSCDLPRDRPCITSIHTGKDSQRLILHPQDYDLAGTDSAYENEAHWVDQAQRALAGESSLLEPSLVWNGGFYLWQADVVDSLEAGISLTRLLLQNGTVAQTLERLKQTLEQVCALSPT